MCDFYDYWSLENVALDDNGRDIEGLIILGINPLKEVTDIIDDLTANYSVSNEDRIVYLNLLARNMLENMERCIYRLKREARQKDTSKSTETNETENIEKLKSSFEDHRFWEYVAQIRVDKHDPADVLEAWLKEHNPDYFND